MTQVDTLAKFGSEFQSKCVVALMTDRDFLEQSMDVTKPEFFDSNANSWIVNRIFWYFTEYKELPTIQVFAKELLKYEGSDVEKTNIKEHLRDVWKNLSATDLTYVKDELMQFCKNQALKSAVLRSAELLQSGQYDQIKLTIDKALNAGIERNIGHNWNEELETRISQAARNTIPTRWNIINHILDGGLGAGELGCWIAPSGIGKSWILQDIGQYAMSIGKTVVHYTFELSETYTGLRYDSIMTGIEPQKIRDHTSIVENAIKQIPGKLFIKYFPTRAINIGAIYSHLNRMIQLGNKPDLIIVDYADLMRGAEKAQARHEELGFIYEEIRGLLGEFGLPGWTASQSQRSAIQDDIIEADKIAGAYAKIMVCDAVFSASRKQADKIANTARVYCIKNRFGPDGIEFPARMDFSKGEVGIYDKDSIEGIKIKQLASQGQGTINKMLYEKLLEINDTKKNLTPDLG